jgi:hypothetical protein
MQSARRRRHTAATVLQWGELRGRTLAGGSEGLRPSEIRMSSMLPQAKHTHWGTRNHTTASVLSLIPALAAKRQGRNQE